VQVVGASGEDHQHAGAHEAGGIRVGKHAQVPGEPGLRARKRTGYRWPATGEANGLIAAASRLMALSHGGPSRTAPILGPRTAIWHGLIDRPRCSAALAIGTLRPTPGAARSSGLHHRRSHLYDPFK